MAGAGPTRRRHQSPGPPLPQQGLLPAARSLCERKVGLRWPLDGVGEGLGRGCSCLMSKDRVLALSWPLWGVGAGNELGSASWSVTSAGLVLPLPQFL